MGRWNVKQKQLIGEFLSNFALVWLTFGLVSPVFSGIGNVFDFMLRLILALAIAYGNLKAATRLLK